MRVKVTYGIDLNDAPETAKTILESIEKRIEGQLAMIRSIDSLLPAQETVTLVPTILQKVSDESTMIDASLKDVLSLMTGFVQVLAASEVEEKDVDPPAAPKGSD